MPLGLRGLAASWASELRATGYRGLLVVHSSDPGRAVEAVVRAALDAGHRELLCVSAGAGRLGVGGCSWAGASSLERLLGREFDAAVLVAPGFLAPNTVAAVAESGARVIMVVERDQNIPELGECVREVERIAALQSAARVP